VLNPREPFDCGWVGGFSTSSACLDNAIIESFWATLKKELIYQTHFKTRDEARLTIFEYIEVFCQRSAEALPSNQERLHISLLYQTPYGFELNQSIQAKEVLIHSAA
jgi:transposase InsO family protein